MANPNDTSKPPRSRRNQPKGSATITTATLSDEPTAASDQPASTPPTPPLTLEEAIENERTALMQIRGMLHCLYGVLLYAEDDDTIMHAEVAQVSARLINDTCVRLDSVNLQPLIDAARNRGGAKPPRGDEPYLPQPEPYQVREPTPVYYLRN